MTRHIVRAASVRLVLGILLSFASLTHAGPADGPPVPAPIGIVNTRSGSVSGVEAARGISLFRGIPYAAPPVGERRLRPPAPPPQWTDVRKAEQFGALCPQHGNPPSGQTMSEDCLTANVWTGASAAERRPVFVWIYGGGFSEGSASNPQFDGTALAQKGVVVVTFNYRLGPLGFLATPELAAENGQIGSGNFGLLDDIALLHWVQQNIAAFGGDPGRVTIGGQSAGAGSAGFLALSPLARGLFHRAILQSHARHPGDTELRYLSTSWRSREAAERQGAAFAAARGADTPDKLRALPWQTLLDGSAVSDPEVDSGSDSRPPLFRPVIDGVVLPKNYADSLASGTQNPVLVIAGNNLDETGAIPAVAVAGWRASPPALRPGMPTVHVTLDGYRAGAHRKFGPMAAEFLRLYPASTDDEAAASSAEAARDNSRAATFFWAGEWARSGPQPIRTYYWTRAHPGMDGARRGAFHGSEIPFMFGSFSGLDRPWTDADRAVAERMTGYWANFIATGDPNGPGLPEWPAWRADQAQVMELGTAFAPIAVATPDRLDFWRRFFASQPQW